MKNIFLQFLVLFLFSTALYAQNNEQKGRLIDSFGSITTDDLLGRIGIYWELLKDNPKAKVLVKISGGAITGAYVRGALIKTYLKNNDKLSAEKFTVQFCNINKAPIETRLYILDENEKIETCEENLTVPDKTVLFESLYFYYKDSVFSSKEPFENFPIEGEGPDTHEYFQTVQDVLKRLLNQTPDSKIYLIGYLGTNRGWTNTLKKERDIDKPNALNKFFRQVENEYLQSGIDASRIVKINGGYKDSVKSIEIWFVPKGGEIPKAKPETFPKKKKKRKVKI
jgi:hypothetical protein